RIGQSGMDVRTEQAYQQRIAELTAQLAHRDATIAALQQQVACSLQTGGWSLGRSGPAVKSRRAGTRIPPSLLPVISLNRRAAPQKNLGVLVPWW
ncbi:MAG: hypothetical protein ACP5O7_13225, partial [Phycisphaerae bacterium]